MTPPCYEQFLPLPQPISCFRRDSLVNPTTPLQTSFTVTTLPRPLPPLPPPPSPNCQVNAELHILDSRNFKVVFIIILKPGLNFMKECQLYTFSSSHFVISSQPSLMGTLCPAVFPGLCIGSKVESYIVENVFRLTDVPS